jgi:hypothetical protein
MITRSGSGTAMGVCGVRGGDEPGAFTSGAAPLGDDWVVPRKMGGGRGRGDQGGGGGGRGGGGGGGVEGGGGKAARAKTNSGSSAADGLGDGLVLTKELTDVFHAGVLPRLSPVAGAYIRPLFGST